MCTAVRFSPMRTYFGRTLDYERSYGESVVITPRIFPLPFRHHAAMPTHYAIIGMAHIEDGYPLYYDGMNEHGLGIAGLNFPENAIYRSQIDHMDNIAVFELIPWVLGQCRSIREAKVLFQNLNLTDTPFNASLPVTPLHWLLADREAAVTLEATLEGIQVYENPVGVLTNNPPFPMQMHNLHSYLSLSPQEPVSRFTDGLVLKPFSRGMGALGLPGDLSSQSRFVRAAFTALNSLCDAEEESAVTQFFHILETVSQTRGCCRLADQSCEITIYTSCCSLDTGIYYYTDYENRQITATDMRRADLDSRDLILFPLVTQQQIQWQNR